MASICAPETGSVYLRVSKCIYPLCLFGLRPLEGGGNPDGDCKPLLLLAGWELGCVYNNGLLLGAFRRQYWC